MNKKKTFLLVFLVILLCIMTLGYAALQERIDIEGEANIDSTYRVEITSVSEGAKNGDAKSTNVPSYTGLQATFNVGLTNTTDYITYTIEITNYSSVDIRLNNTTITSTNNNITYSKSGIRNGDTMLVGSTRTITLKIKLKDATQVEQTGAIHIIFDFTRLKGGTGQVTIDNSYVIGDIIPFAGSNWYVIKDSTDEEDYVTLMKERVLTNAELGSYAYNSTYDTMEFTWTATCHNKNHGYSSADTSNCNNTNGYATSKVKEFLEGSYLTSIGANKLKAVDLNGTSYKVRLITTDELVNDLGWASGTSTYATTSGNSVPTWVYKNFGEGQNNVSRYWTMTPYANTSSGVWGVISSGNLNIYSVGNGDVGGVRPVINLLKSEI